MAVVNPAKRLQSDIEPGLDIIRSWGLEPVLGQYVHQAHNLFSGTDDERLADLQWALDDPETKAIIIARGGYGTTRILDRLNFDAFDKRPKWICGFSDITSLTCQVDNMGIASVHSPMVASLGRDQASDEYLRDLLFGRDIDYKVQTKKACQPGEASGTLIGGNLTIICNSIGTSSEIQTEGKILFLEEVGEYIYHLDRMLVQLKRAGKLDGLSGVVVGDFSSMKDHNDTFGYSTMEVLRSHFDQLDCPVAYGFPSGHEHKNFPLLCGKETKLEVKENEIRLVLNQSENHPASLPG